jgi:hypothetical protein
MLRRRPFDDVRDDVMESTDNRRQPFHLRLAAGETGFLLHRGEAGLSADGSM